MLHRGHGAERVLQAQPADAEGAGVEQQRVVYQALHVHRPHEAAPGGEGQLLQDHEQLPVQGHVAGEGQGLLPAVQHLLAEAGAVHARAGLEQQHQVDEALHVLGLQDVLGQRGHHVGVDGEGEGAAHHEGGGGGVAQGRGGDGSGRGGGYEGTAAAAVGADAAAAGVGEDENTSSSIHSTWPPRASVTAAAWAISVTPGAGWS